MREGRPSLTAALVAAARGVGRSPIDPLAIGLLPDLAAPFLTLASRAPDSVLSAFTLGFTDHLTLRTRAIDAALLEALSESRVPQLVIVGAGLDARAYRMPELSDTVCFEVDHPDTQIYKRSRVTGEKPKKPTALRVEFVPVNFESEALGDCLRAAGHDAEAPTFWIWEGVTPYLHLPAIAATANAIGARSAQGSRAAVTYATPRMTPLGGAFGRAARRAFRLLGEPLHGLVTPAQIEKVLTHAGFSLIQDDGVRDWAARFGVPRERRLLVDERLAVALRV